MNSTPAEGRRKRAVAVRPVGPSGVDPAASTGRLVLIAAVIAIAADEPVVAVLPAPDGTASDGLPATTYAFGGGDALGDALRTSIEQQIGRVPVYLQHLTAFDSQPPASDVLVGYLGLAHGGDAPRPRHGRRPERAGCLWLSCYRYLPWEDWRSGRPRVIDDIVVPLLERWAQAIPAAFAPNRTAAARLQAERAARTRLAFASPATAWNDERVLARFELLVEAGLIPEERPCSGLPSHPNLALGCSMAAGHRRILATALSRLRADLRVRPVTFELMPEEFSLYDLQRTVEIILGPNLHKQNFRRLVESADLVEPTGGMKSHTGGRPAKLYRFRRDVLLQRPGAGQKLGC